MLIYHLPPHASGTKQVLMQAHLWHQDDGDSQQCNDKGDDASIDDGDRSSSGSHIRACGPYQTAVGPGKWMVTKFCGICKYKNRLVTIEEAFVELEKYVDASDQRNTNLPNMLHLGSLPQTAGWINWL